MAKTTLALVAFISIIFVEGCTSNSQISGSLNPTTFTTAAAPGSTALQSSVTKDGITWTFSQPVPVGQFVTGDYYVIGPVTITTIDPAPTTATPYENGSGEKLPTSNK